MYFLADRFGMPISKMLDEMPQSEFFGWKVWHDADYWKNKILSTDEERSNRILKLITTGN